MGSSGLPHRGAGRRRAAALAALAGLLLAVWQADAEETGLPPAPGLASDRFQDAVDDTELKSIYGRGSDVQVLRVDNMLSVILWDEGKRKIRIHNIRTDIGSEIRRQRAPSPQ